MPKKSQPIEAPPLQEFSTGAKRGTPGILGLEYMSPHVYAAFGSAAAEGAEQYGDYNNLKGFPLSTLWRHMMRHLLFWWWGDTREDHLGHALWNLCQMVHQQGQGMYDLDDRPPVAFDADSMRTGFENTESHTAKIVNGIRERKQNPPKNS